MLGLCMPSLAAGRTIKLQFIQQIIVYMRKDFFQICTNLDKNVNLKFKSINLPVA